MVRAIIQENPDLEAAIEEADEEGEATFGAAYIPGVDFMVETLDGSLLIEPATYRAMRTTMIHYASIAMRN
jgi:hypothetical protein